NPSLAAGASLPPLTLTVIVGAGTPSSVTNMATVSTPDELNIADNTASDPTNVMCPTITAIVSGGGPVCAGNSATVTVTVSGGTAPYTVTLDNGGGMQMGIGPTFNFMVSPSMTTVYSAAASDVNGCPA